MSTPYYTEGPRTEGGGKSYLKGVMPTETSPQGQQEIYANDKAMRDFLKSGVRPGYIAFNILKPEISVQMDSAHDFKKKSLPVLFNAFIEMKATKVKYSIERQYRGFYDEFQQHQHDWKLFFSKENNQFVWAERTCAILGNLATIYRQRGTYAQCAEVMEPYKYVVVLARQIAGLLSYAVNDELVCCHLMTFKYHRVAVNLANCMDKTEGIGKSYRFLFQHEIDHSLADTPHAEYVWMMHISEALANTTDAELEALAALSHQYKPDSSFQSKSEYLQMNSALGAAGCGQYGGGVVLAQCVNCSFTESFLSTYKLCARCKTVKYCSRECQMAHYQGHKRACKKTAAGK